MVKCRGSLLAVLLAAAVPASGPVWAANEAPAAPPPMKEASATAAQAVVDEDINRISAAGAAAFANILFTRRAIFEGRTDDARTYVALAEAGFNKAKSNGTVYNKAGADLKMADGKAGAGKAATATTTPPPDKGAPIAWAPVDASITIAEDITGNAAKTAAVGDANESLKTGDRDAAMKKLKVAGIVIAITLAVMPIDATIDKARQAAVLIDAGKYYEGSQQLRLAEAGERYDMIGNLGTPKE